MVKLGGVRRMNVKAERAGNIYFLCKEIDMIQKIKFIQKREVSERGGEVVNGLVEGSTKGERGKKRREVINRKVK